MGDTTDMKLKVFDGTPAHEGETMLRLIQLSETEVMLAVVGGDGKCVLDNTETHGGALLIINNGYLVRSPAVMPQLGFHLDITDRVQLGPEGESQAAVDAQRYGGKRAAFRLVDKGERWETQQKSNGRSRTMAKNEDRVFRTRAEKKGGHIHVRIFSAISPNHTFAGIGCLTMDEADYVAFKAAFNGEHKEFPA